MNHNISGMKFYVARQVAEVQIHLKTAAHEGQKAFGEALVNLERFVEYSISYINCLIRKLCGIRKLLIYTKAEVKL